MANEKEKYTLKEVFEVISKHLKYLADESIKKGIAGPKAPGQSMPGAGGSAGLHTKDKSKMQGVGPKPTMATAFNSLEKSASKTEKSGSKSGSKSMDKAETAIEKSGYEKSQKEREKEMSGSKSKSKSESKSPMEKSVSGEKSKSESSKSKSVDKMEADDSGMGGV